MAVVLLAPPVPLIAAVLLVPAEPELAVPAGAVLMSVPMLESMDPLPEVVPAVVPVFVLLQAVLKARAPTTKSWGIRFVVFIGVGIKFRATFYGISQNKYIFYKY
ncbi:hypothetical protein GCM10027175_11460 [Hymenobacter latericoloratus]